MNNSPSVDFSQFDAVILDLDGVITQTAHVHARAWKQMFDEYREHRRASRQSDFEPFDISRDYPQYLDGKSRLDGIRSFLQSRGLALPEGSPDDAPGWETVTALGARKNQIFHALLQQGTVDVYEDTLDWIHRWRDRQMKLGVVSSSRNCAAILEAAGLSDLFSVRVDGVEAERLGLQGKPAPDLFLQATHELHVEPGRSIVVEDARSGVQAARAGDFGLIIGVDRQQHAEQLKAAGADLVIATLGELMEQNAPHPPPHHDSETAPVEPCPSAIHRIEEFLNQCRGRQIAWFLDYDGTLTPIVEHPEDATLSDEMRDVLNELAARFPVAIVSGRDLADVRQMVGLEHLVYAGSHGFDIAGPEGLSKQQAEGQTCLPDLDRAEQELKARLTAVPKARVERKRFAIAIHYRQVADPDVSQVETIVDDIQKSLPRLRKQGGKKIFELQPNIEWNKGKAVLWLLNALGLDRADVVPIYIGDDVTDEHAFEALADRGFSIRVGPAIEPTKAKYCVEEVADLQTFLQQLIHTWDQPH